MNETGLRKSYGPNHMRRGVEAAVDRLERLTCGHVVWLSGPSALASAAAEAEFMVEVSVTLIHSGKV